MNPIFFYQGSLQDFSNKINTSSLVKILEDKTQEIYGAPPRHEEIQAYANSLSALKDLLERAKLQDCMLMLEYQIPYGEKSRIDCILFGTSQTEKQTVFLIELKQWNKAELSEDGTHVVTYTGGEMREVAHPSQQVRSYQETLESFLQVFSKPDAPQIISCSYCHNYIKVEGSGLFHPQFKNVTEKTPVYTKSEETELIAKLQEYLGKGKGEQVLNHFIQSKIKPTPKILSNTAHTIDSCERLNLIGKQIDAKNAIWGSILKFRKTHKKSVIIVQGNPGSGKTRITLKLLAEAARRNLNVQVTCKSKPYTASMMDEFAEEQDVRKLFSNLDDLSSVEENNFDLLLIDEAHRIESKRVNRSRFTQVEQLIVSAKTCVFFIDERQQIRPGEIGTVQLIRDAAIRLGVEIDDSIILEGQYRCRGSSDYMCWLESVLGYTKETYILQKNNELELKIFDSGRELYETLVQKQKELQSPTGARLVAGFCWPWSSHLERDGSLVKDVKLNDIELPWETSDRVKAPPGYVPWHKWPYKEEGVKQVGCIYTAQGFDFDYVGVVIADDFIYDPTQKRLIGNFPATCYARLKTDPTHFEKYVRNIYWVLLTRATTACYLYFTNQQTRKFFESRIQGSNTV